MSEKRADEDGTPRYRVDVAGLAPGETRALELAGLAILLCNVDGEIFAVENRCSHAAVPLTDACLSGHELECVHHGALFDVRDGAAIALPARRPLRSFPVARDGDSVVIAIVPDVDGEAPARRAAGTNEERLAPLTPAQWSEKMGRALGNTIDGVAELEQAGSAPPPARKPLAILATIAHHPSLLEPFLGFSSAIALRGVLSRRESELLALRAAWNCRSEFEWGHHVRYAQAAGLSETEIDRVLEGPEAEGWSRRDSSLLRAADELHRDDRIGDATWRVLRDQFDDAQLVEIPFVVGQYAMLSGVANSLGVALEAGHEPLPGVEGRRPSIEEAG